MEKAVRSVCIYSWSFLKRLIFHLANESHSRVRERMEDIGISARASLLRYESNSHASISHRGEAWSLRTEISRRGNLFSGSYYKQPALYSNFCFSSLTERSCICSGNVSAPLASDLSTLALANVYQHALDYKYTYLTLLTQRLLYPCVFYFIPNSFASSRTFYSPRVTSPSLPRVPSTSQECTSP